MALEILTKIEMIHDEEELKRLEENYKKAKGALMSYLWDKEGLKLTRAKETAPDVQHQAQFKGLHEMSDEEIREFALRFYDALHDMHGEERQNW